MSSGQIAPGDERGVRLDERQEQALASIVSESMERLKKVARRKTPEQEDAFKDALTVFLREITRRHVQRTDELEQLLAWGIGQFDRLLTKQLNPILHDPGFQRLEGTWRGLHYLIHKSQTGEDLQIRVLNASKRDLLEDFARASDVDQSGFFKAVFSSGFDRRGGRPYGALLGDFYFGPGHEDVELLERIGEVAQAAHAPFFGGTDPSMFGLDEFSQLDDPRDLSEIFKGEDYARWRSLRKKQLACYLGLTLPRVLARLPYGEQKKRVSSFRFEEDASGKTGYYCWMNTVWAWGAKLTESFSRTGFFMQVWGEHGKVKDLPYDTFRLDNGVLDARCPTEVGITLRRENELDKLGFIPLSHYQHTDYATFASASSVNLPEEYLESVPTESAFLMSKIPRLMALSRFTHYLKAILLQKQGQSLSANELETALNNWINSYVLLNATGAGQNLKGQKPLKAAKVTVVDDEKPDHYRATIRLATHDMVESVIASFRLVRRLEGSK